MDTLRSLLFITESDLPADGPVAVEDLVKYFPSKHGQAIEKLWGSHRLTYKGKQFFTEEGNDHGPVYKGAMEAGEEAAKKETVNFQLEPGQTDNHDWRATIQDAEDEGLNIPTFEVDVKLDEMQEVYLGFQPKTGKLYIGFDAWTDHNDLDGEIDDYMNGIDADEPVRDAIENAIHHEMKDLGFFGVLVELSSTDGENFEAHDVVTEPGGFYRGIHNTRAHGSHAFKHLGLIDLRLD